MCSNISIDTCEILIHLTESGLLKMRLLDFILCCVREIGPGLATSRDQVVFVVAVETESRTRCLRYVQHDVAGSNTEL